VRLGKQSVIQDVGFTIRRGERLGVIGPNGAGKTSLLETMAGFLSPVAGQIQWRGRPLPAAARPEVMFYLPDGVRPCPDHRAGDILRLFRIVYRQTPARAAELVGALEIGPVLDRRAGELSKGCAKRWLLALGMLSRAPLLLLDEPVDGLDLHQVLRLERLLERLREEGRTLVLSIHELSLAERLCDRFLLLSAGRLLGIGDLPALQAQAGLLEGGLSEIFLALT